MSSCSARFSEKSSAGVVEDGDQVAQSLDAGLAVAELVRVVEVGEIAAGKPCVGVDQRLDDLGVDLVADIRVALDTTISLKLRPRE